RAPRGGGAEARGPLGAHGRLRDGGPDRGPLPPLLRLPGRRRGLLRSVRTHHRGGRCPRRRPRRRRRLPLTRRAAPHQKDSDMSAPEMTSDAPVDSYELAIGGMTCSSCAMRIEKKLNRLDGVEASVNYAT